MEIKKIFVAGAGLMGGGIAQVCAQAGYDVTMRDLTEEILEKSLKAIHWSVGKLVEKGRVEGSTDAIMGRIKTSTDLSGAAEADFVFEAIIENLEAKREIFKELDSICPQHTILATNSSAIPVTEIAEATRRVPQVTGTHFFSPVPMMKAVEIVKGLGTAEQTVEIADKLCRSLGKETIRVNRDVAGIVLNRINFPSTIEAIKLVEAGVTTVEDIDKGMTEGAGFVIGPFRLLDHVGLDIIYNSANSFYNEFKETRFAPPPLLKRMVMAGNLGRKTGKGFYTYKKER